jgi:hypothetical protein
MPFNRGDREIISGSRTLLALAVIARTGSAFRKTGTMTAAAAAFALLSGQSIAPLSAATNRYPIPGAFPPLAQPVATLPFAVEDIVATTGKDAPVAITLPSESELQSAGAETGTFVLIRNVPQVISFSTGMSTGRVWVVPLRETDTLKLISQPQGEGSYQLEFSLIGPGNRVLATRQVPVELRAPAIVAREIIPDRQTTAAAASPEPVPRSVVVQPAKPIAPSKPVAKDEEARLLQRGNQLIKEGAVSEARLILKWLADRGSGAGALALAQSYDNAFVSAYPASAIAPDMQEARRWYERAAELQNGEAKKRLSELPAR